MFHSNLIEKIKNKFKRTSAKLDFSAFEPTEYKSFQTKPKQPQMPTPIQPSIESKQAVESIFEGARGIGEALKRAPGEQFTKSQQAWEKILPKVKLPGGRIVAIDPFGFSGGLKAIGNIGKVAKIIAQEVRNAPKIAKLLIEDLKGLGKEGADAMSEILLKVNNAEDVQRVLNKTKSALQKKPITTTELQNLQFQNATRKRKALESASAKGLDVSAFTPKRPIEITPDLQPLAKEAQKFKTAEEFVEAQPKLFRAGELGVDNKAGIFLSRDKGVAEQYLSLTGDPKTSRKLNEFIMSPTAKIKQATTRDELLKELDPTFDGEELLEKLFRAESRVMGRGEIGLVKGMTPKQRFETTVEKRILDKLKKQGFDGVEYTGKGLKSTNDQTGELQIFNRNVIKTKSQLKDFYNKAKEVKPISKTEVAQTPSQRPREKPVEMERKISKEEPLPKTEELQSRKEFQQVSEDVVVSPYKKSISEKKILSSKVSKARQRANEGILDDYKISEEYKVAHMDKEIENAVKLIQKDKDEALSIAMGKTKSSDNTMMATNFVMKEKAIQEGNWSLVNKLMTQAYDTGTRLGQELAMMKANITQNPHERFIRRIVETRMNDLKMGTPKLRAEKVKIMTDKLKSDIKKVVKSKYRKAESANAFLASITC